MTQLKTLTAADVLVTFRVEPEDLPVRGYVMASGDDAFDRKVEDEIINRLESGDELAWFCAVVEVHWRDFRGIATLGCCTYASAEDFKAPGGYYDDMIQQALDDLNANIAAVAATLSELQEPQP